jgi:hypothetical protein
VRQFTSQAQRTAALLVKTRTWLQRMLGSGVEAWGEGECAGGSGVGSGEGEGVVGTGVGCGVDVDAALLAGGVRCLRTVISGAAQKLHLIIIMRANPQFIFNNLLARNSPTPHQSQPPLLPPCFSSLAIHLLPFKLLLPQSSLPLSPPPFPPYPQLKILWRCENK